MTNNQELKQLMREYGLTHKTVSIALGVSINKVNCYCLSPNSDRFIEVPYLHLDHIKAICRYIDRVPGDTTIKLVTKLAQMIDEPFNVYEPLEK